MVTALPVLMITSKENNRSLLLEDFATRSMQEIAEENELLRDFVATSRDALWCIEYIEPVDLSAPESEIIRQLFENYCVWRMCNPAMARLYGLPEELDFNAQKVRFFFSRNPTNERFVRKLIASNFHVEGVTSLDSDYAGRHVTMENDVRGHIKDGHLHRMMGAVRNLNPQTSRKQTLEARVLILTDILGTLPDPVIVVNACGEIESVGPALAWQFGCNVDEVLGRPVKSLVPRWNEIVGMVTSIGVGEPGLDLTISISLPANRGLRCAAHVAAFEDAGGSLKYVLLLRAPGEDQNASAANESMDDDCPTHSEG
ncbi:MAG: PAS domain-containing protein [Gammaproteobacteria bacterium]|jgi:PAS domain-containing protein